jgi:hypothetical protein
MAVVTGQHYVNVNAISTSASTQQRGCGQSQFIEISDFLLEEYKRPLEDTEKKLMVSDTRDRHTSRLTCGWHGAGPVLW